jgi:pyruvate dehydrogenase E1 component
LLQQRMNETVDGEYQNFKAKGGGYVRERFFGPDEELLEMVENLSDADIYRLNRGGHDPYKVYAAYHAAVHHKGQPTVVLAKTIKGYGMGDAGESENDTHQVKKLNIEELKHFRDRFDVPLSDKELEGIPYFRPADDSPEMVYFKQKRAALGGPIPQRVTDPTRLQVPDLSAFEAQTKGSGERSISSTMAFVRILATLVRNKQIGERIVPIVPDEARTFGMDGMFRQLGIYSSVGQLYTPEDADELSSYVESKDGQVMEEGINEAGAFAAWLSAATSHSTHRYSLIPFYIYYSMFGFQRVGDLAWAAGDLQARGFLLGGTAGRTTLNGEGLQHQDGHSHLLAATVPNCISYDPCYAYELAVIVQRGLERMYVEQDPVYYYITVMNENYPHPPMPAGVEQGIINGMYHMRTLGEDPVKRVRLLGSGAILREVEAAAEMLHQQYDVSVELWSVTSFTELARDAQDVARWNILHPDEEPRVAYAAQCLQGDTPVVAASDYMKAVSEQLRSCVSAPYHTLGTDGFGRSDTREKLRHFFEVDRRFITLASLSKLVDSQVLSSQLVKQARDDLGIDAEKSNPRLS